MPAEKYSDKLTSLGQLMSDLSEDCYCAGWLIGTEYLVPELCRRAIETGAPQYWGHGEVSPEQARRLQDIADSVGHWANLDDEAKNYIPFDPFPIPATYIESLDPEPNSGGERDVRAKDD